MIQPLGPSVVVRSDAPDERTKGGIVLPDSAKEKPRVGEVVAVGSGTLIKDGPRAGESVPLEIKVEDRILFAKYGGSTVPDDVIPKGFLANGEELRILMLHDILGIVIGE